MVQPELVVSESLLERIRRLSEASFEGIFPPDCDYRRVALEYVSEERCTEQLDLLRRLLPTPLEGKRILEVGSGYGGFVTVALRNGLDAYGVEPGEQFQGAYDVSVELLADNGFDAERISRGVGEAMPFPDESFDVVYSCNVVEHVETPADVFRESIRVLRPGGHLLFNFPNYGSWWEGHYGILWWPNLSARLGKLYVRLLGRDPSFIDTLRLLNHRQLEAILAPHAHEVEVLDWGMSVWEERVRSLDIAAWAELGTLRRFVQWVRRLGLTELVIRLGRRLHWETPFILILRKR